MVLKNDFVDSDATATVHAQHHNDMATAVNSLAAGSGFGYPLPRISGRYYDANLLGQTTPSTVRPSAGTIYYQPFFAGTANITLDRIGVYMQTALAVAVDARFGIYNNSGYAPSTLLVDFGTVNLGTTTGLKEATISQALSANTLVWLAAHFPQIISPAALYDIGPGGQFVVGGTATDTSAGGRQLYYETRTYDGSALPSTATPAITAAGGASVAPAIRVRIA